MDSKISVASWIHGLQFNDIPADVIARAQDLLLDTLGVAAAAGITTGGRIAHDFAAAQFTDGDNRGAHLPFDGRSVSVSGMAYALATRIDNLDSHDGYQLAKGHAGVALVSALLAFGQDGDTSCTGRDALTALVAGYEIASRAGTTLHASTSTYHSSGAWNALGAAALGAKMRGGDSRLLEDALGIAEYHAPRAPMMREIDAPSMLHDSSGWGTLAGTAAVYLAEQGFSTSPAALPNTGAEWVDLGSRWLVLEQYIKPYPVCFWAQPAVRAAIALRKQHDLSPESIRSVRISAFHEASRLSMDMPETTEAAQYALGFPVATALANGRLTPTEIAGDGLNDAQAKALVPRISVTESSDFNACFPAQRLAAVTVELDDGRVFESEPTQPFGVPSDPLERTDVVDKFREYATPFIGEHRTQTIEESVLNLHERDAALAPLIACILAPRASSHR